MSELIPIPYLRRARKAQVPFAVMEDRIVETALNLSTSHKGSVLFLPKGNEVAKALDISQGQLYRGDTFVGKVEKHTGLSFVHDGVVLSAEPNVNASNNPPLMTAAGRQIELLATTMPKDQLAITIGNLAAQLAAKNI